MTDTAGNTANGTGGTTVKDTTADAGPTATVTINDGDGVISAAEQGAASYTVAGVDADAHATVTFSDGNPLHNVVVASLANGTFAANLSGLSDGPIVASIAVSDTAGNTATGSGDSSSKNTTPVNHPPGITSNGGGTSAAINVAENSTAVTTVVATDPDAGAILGYSIIGGADATKFAINSTSGVLTFAAAPDFESPTDAGPNNVYDVQVQVSDGLGGLDSQAIAVTVTNVAGVTINGTGAANTVDATHTVAGQPLPTNEEDVINGGGGNDVLSGLGGNDTIDGGTNVDRMTGGLGNDTYVVDNTSDVVVENTNEGTDTVKSSVAYTLSSNVENLTLTGSSNVNGTGNALANMITEVVPRIRTGG